MNTSAEEALAALARLTPDSESSDADREADRVDIDAIRSFITQAAREQRAMRSIEGWQVTNPLFELTTYVNDTGKWTAVLCDEGGVTIAYESMFDQPTRLAALEAAAAWCEQQENAK